LVHQLTAAELQELDVGSWFTKNRSNSAVVSPSTSYAGEKLPTLAQAFDLFNSLSGTLYLEMKCDGNERSYLATAVAKLIRECGMENRVVVESFDLRAIVEIKNNGAGIRTAALFEPKLSRPISTVRRLRMIDLALEHRADEIALHYTLVAPRVVEKAKQAGLGVVVWTVDDSKWIARARSLGIKALIANNPAVMVLSRDMSDKL
jgi:glycerophosphoryl diester phosphodiesterase